MLQYLADAETVIDVYLCASAYGHADDRETMVRETHGVRVIFVGDDYFVIGPKRPIHSSVIPLGWVSMIRIHNDGPGTGLGELVEAESTSSPQALATDAVTQPPAMS
jgi:hypothetical protein